MKKSLIALMAAGMVFLGLASASYAQNTLNYTLVVTITTTAIDITGPNPDQSWITLGGVKLGGTITKHLGAINNVGSNTVALSLSVTAVAVQNGWQINTNNTTNPKPALTADQYRLSAMFTQWDRTATDPTTCDPSEPGKGASLPDFDYLDVVTATNQVCAATAPDLFALATENAQYKGFNVTTGQARDLFVLLEIAATATNGQAGNITPMISITAQ